MSEKAVWGSALWHHLTADGPVGAWVERVPDKAVTFDDHTEVIRLTCMVCGGRVLAGLVPIRASEVCGVIVARPFIVMLPHVCGQRRDA